MRKKKNDLFTEVAEEWLEIRRAQWKPSSTVKYRNILRLYLIPEFGERQISEITKNDVTVFGNELLTSGGNESGGLSPKTVAGILSVMKNIFEYAEDMKGCATADIADVTVRQSQKPMRILSRAEQHRLTEYLFTHRNACNLGVLVTLYTGMRIGEICALKWGDVLLEDRCIFVRRTVQRLQTDNRAGSRTAVVVSTPKSDCSIRRIPIERDIFPILRQSYISDNSYLLTGMQENCMEPRTMQNRFKHVIQDCGIAPANYHALRHTFATRCVELGMDVKCLSEILGHASVNITLNRYVHPSMEWKQKNMDRLSELFVQKKPGK